MYLKFFILFVLILSNSLGFAEKSKPLDVYLLRKSIHLGDVAFSVTTQNDEAKQHFLLGTAFLHAFMYDLAIAQFQEAQRLDPGFAMSYWGEAMSYKHPIWNYEDLKAGQSVLNRYQTNPKKSSLSEKERGYMQSVSLLFSNRPLLERDQDYLIAMKKLAEKYPTDPNIGAFYALALLGNASDFPDQSFAESYVKKGRAYIDGLFNKFQQHPGVVHYYLHYHDTADNTLAKEALPAAKIALNVMKSSSHVTHMSAHIYRRLRLWDDYILANKISVEAANSLCKQLDIQPFESCNAENKYHSLEWLHDGYLTTHQFDKATILVQEMMMVAARQPEIIFKQWLYRMWARQVLLTQNWNMSIIPLQSIAKSDDQLYWSAYSECGALQASSFIAIHNKQSIQKQLQRLDAVIELTKTLTDPYIRQSCEIARAEIKAESARVKGEKAVADHWVKKALDLQKKLISTELTPSLSFLTAQD